MPEATVADGTLIMSDALVIEVKTALVDRHGYKVAMIPDGPDAGYHVLRVTYMELAELRQLRKAAAAFDVENEVAQGLETSLAGLIPEWDLVDRDGKPRPQPKDDPSVFDHIDPINTLAFLLGMDEDGLWGDVLTKKVRSAGSSRGSLTLPTMPAMTTSTPPASVNVSTSP